MRPLVNNHNKEVREHLLAQFGTIDECCGVMSPTILASFQVQEALKTAGSGFGVDENNCIPPGSYYIKKGLEGGCNSHCIWIGSLENDSEIFVTVGYAGDPPDTSTGDTRGGTCIDWRGVKKCIKTEEVAQ